MLLLLLLPIAHTLAQDTLLTAANCSLAVPLHPPLNMVQSYRFMQAPDMRCAVTFFAPQHHGLLIQVAELDTNPGPFDCDLGAVRLYSVRGGQTALLNTLCGMQNRSSASLTENLAVLTFSSDHASSGSGFTVLVQLIGRYYQDGGLHHKSYQEPEPTFLTSNLLVPPAPVPQTLLSLDDYYKPSYGSSQPDMPYYYTTPPPRVYYHSEEQNYKPFYNPVTQPPNFKPAKSFYEGTVQKVPYYQPDKTFYGTPQTPSSYWPSSNVYKMPNPAKSYYQFPPLKTEVSYPSLPKTYYGPNSPVPGKYYPALGNDYGKLKPVYQPTKAAKSYYSNVIQPPNSYFQTTPKDGKIYYEQTTEPYFLQPTYQTTESTKTYYETATKAPGMYYHQPTYDYQTQKPEKNYYQAVTQAPGTYQHRIDYHTPRPLYGAGTKFPDGFNQPATVYQSGSYLCKECNQTYWLAGKEKLPELTSNYFAPETYNLF